MAAILINPFVLIAGDAGDLSIAEAGVFSKQDIALSRNRFSSLLLATFAELGRRHLLFFTKKGGKLGNRFEIEPVSDFRDAQSGSA